MKTGVENDIFLVQIGSGFGEPGDTPPPRIPRRYPGKTDHVHGVRMYSPF